MEKLNKYLPNDTRQTLVIAAVAFVILMTATFLAYEHAKGRQGGLVFPAGVTYLGPTPTQAPLPTSDRITVPPDATWNTQKGTIYPYEFLYPSTLTLGVFPGDPFDSVTIFWGNSNPQENLLLRVEDLNKIPDMKQYISTSKKEYAQIWWKQYSWKGVASVDAFTNSKGMKGFRAKYVDSQGKTPSDNIFFEVPGRPDLVIWMSSRLLDPTILGKIVDSLSWK